MSPRLKSVAPLPDYRLLLTFDNEERRLFDVKPYLNKGVFSAARRPVALPLGAQSRSTPWNGPTEPICAWRSCTPRVKRPSAPREGRETVLLFENGVGGETVPATFLFPFQDSIHVEVQGLGEFFLNPTALLDDFVLRFFLVDHAHATSLPAILRRAAPAFHSRIRATISPNSFIRGRNGAVRCSTSRE